MCSEAWESCCYSAVDFGIGNPAATRLNKSAGRGINQPAHDNQLPTRFLHPARKISTATNVASAPVLAIDFAGHAERNYELVRECLFSLAA